MLVLTTDGRRLMLVRMGKHDCEAGSNLIVCRADTGEEVNITWQDVALTFGSYSFPPVDKQRLKAN